MKIKTKLTLNVAAVLAMIGTVATVSIVGMGFIKNNLSYLTERSTPYQMRTIEFQRAMQGATADLNIVSASKNGNEYKVNRAGAEKSLSDVEKMEDALEAISGGAEMETYDALNNVAMDLFRITEERLKAEEGAGAANQTINSKLDDISNKLRNLDTKIKAMQGNHSSTFMASLDDTKDISSKLRNIELLRTIVKDIQLGFSDIQKSKDRKSIIVARGKVNSAVSQALLNEYLVDSKAIHDDIKYVGDKIEELSRLQLSVFNQADSDTKNRYDAVTKNISEKLSSVLLAIEQGILEAGEKYGMKTRKQGAVYTQSNMATKVLINNSEILAHGLSVAGLSTKIFTLASESKLDGVESDLRKVFEKIESAKVSLEASLGKVDAKEELKIFQNVREELTFVRGLLFASNGVIAKVRHKLRMDAKASQMTEKLRNIVISQAEKGRVSISIAGGEQEKAIGTVNRMIRYSTILVLFIGIAAVGVGIGFGTWVYRSIANPLSRLMKVSDDVSSGDLTADIDVGGSGDEIGSVQASMAKMVSNLKEIAGKISNSTGTLASSSEQLSATAAALEKGASDQTAQVEQSAAAATQMSQTNVDMSKNASSTADAARKMKESAIGGKETMDATVRELERFADAVRQSATKVESLGQNSRDISAIVSLIKEIADQTNLLALNAAIEAARAGDQGMGFAVVADNVRQLAERTTASADDIAGRVQAMQTEIAGTMDSMKAGRETVGGVLARVNGAKTSIEEIVSLVEQVTDMVQRIAAATEEQSSASEEVSRNMENASTITRRLGTFIAEIKKSSDSLARVAVELDTTAGWFRTRKA